MALDIEAELAAEGATAWAALDHVAVGAHRPRARDVDEQWDEVERQYCFGVSDTPCEVEVEGEGRIVVGPDIVRFHAAGDRIRSVAPAHAASTSTWVVLSAEFLEGVLREADGPGRGKASHAPYARSFVRAPLPELAALRTFFRRVEMGASALWIEEAVTVLLPALLRCREDRNGHKSREASPRQLALAREADDLLARNYASNLSLSDVASALGISAPHLARSYHAATGGRMHKRLTSLRLAAAMEQLARGAPDLTMLGLDLGFASHSHFTAAFRQSLGMPPSMFRALCRAGSAVS